MSVSNLESFAYQAMFQTMVDSVIISDKKGQILYVNPATTSLFGYSVEEFIGESIKIIMPVYHVEKHDQYMQTYLQSHEPKVIGKGRKVMAKTKHGDLLPCWLSLSEFEYDGQIYFTGILSDIREIEKAQQELKTINEGLEQSVSKRTAELKKALEKSKELNDLKSKFLTLASHEFKTPLSTILSSAILIKKHGEREQNITDSQEKHIQRIERSVGILNTLIEEFISIERAEANIITKSVTSFNPKELIDEAITLIQVQKKGNQHIHTVFPEIMDNITTDYQLSLQILLNLLSNASKYSSDNQDIFLEYHDYGDNVEFRVIDQGWGISPNDQQHIFDRFFRADNVQSEKGTGIGLHISKNYAKILQGDLGFSSQLNQGSCFIFTLPKVMNSND